VFSGRRLSARRNAARSAPAGPHRHARAAPAHRRGAAPPWGAPALAAAVDAHSAALRRLLGLEREVAAYWTAVYFRDAAAADPGRTWPGLLLYWVRQARCCARDRMKLLSLVFQCLFWGMACPSSLAGFMAC